MSGSRIIASGLLRSEALTIAAAPRLADACAKACEAYDTANPNWSVVVNGCANALERTATP